MIGKIFKIILIYCTAMAILGCIVGYWDTVGKVLREVYFSLPWLPIL